MITLQAQADGIRVEQWCEGPAVYLDHWAWRRISEDVSLAMTFARALGVSGGTLAMSWLNLVEFCRVTDPEQRRKADALLDQVLPRVFFLDPDFFKVIGAENRMLAGSSPEAPHSDSASLKGFVKLNLLRPGSLELLPPQRLFQLIPDTGIATKFDEFADLVVAKIRSMQEEHVRDKGFRRLVRRPPRGPTVQRGTRFLARELLGAFFEPGARLDRSDAIDVCHAVVAVAYCDVALLDGRWVAQVEKARKRLSEVGMSFPVAQVFSERGGGLGDFLHRLTAIPKAPGH
jgi:hypothetical protein